MGKLKTFTLPGPLGVLVQPIVETSGGNVRIFAVECLTRGPRGTRLHEASPLFDYVRRRGLELEMDHACITKALRTAPAGGDYQISINVHPTTVADRNDFVAFLIRESERAGVALSRLILEIGEQTPAADVRAYCSILDRLRELGVAIAVDDVGYGHSNYKSILDCRPDYLKIDRYFVDHASDDGARRAVVHSILDLAGYFGATVVAEGVERPEDHETLMGMGINLFQGYLFGRPHAVEVSSEVGETQAIGCVRSGSCNTTRPSSSASSMFASTALTSGVTRSR